MPASLPFVLCPLCPVLYLPRDALDALQTMAQPVQSRRTTMDATLPALGSSDASGDQAPPFSPQSSRRRNASSPHPSPQYVNPVPSRPVDEDRDMKALSDEIDAKALDIKVIQRKIRRAKLSVKRMEKNLGILQGELSDKQKALSRAQMQNKAVTSTPYDDITSMSSDDTESGSSPPPPPFPRSFSPVVPQ